jgi:signal transduction histidine kinase
MNLPAQQSLSQIQPIVEPGGSGTATILVVDDTPDNLVLMSTLLMDTYKVKIANHGEKALQIARSEAAPDLILLDIMMPGMDGFEVCRRLKHDPRTANIPVIFLTARADVEDEKQGLELGAVDYITKPISPSIVLARVKNHLALKSMADFLQLKNLELETARSVAEKANLAKSDFLSSMSHELRSPLNAILGFAQLMESELPPPTRLQKEGIAQILQAGWHLLRLINEILDLARIESRQMAMSVEPVSLAEVLSECQGMIEPQAKQRGIKLAFPVPDTPLFVLADRTRLKQVLINLLSNAVKYNVSEGTIEAICSKGAQGCLRISIKDSGAGLSAEQLDQLFQPFNRLGQEDGTEEGTGIGLVVAKQLVELMGGTIGVESTVGAGSVFWFELVSVSEPLPSIGSAVAAASSRQSAPHIGRVRTLLYIEDNPVNMKLVEQIIARRPELRLLGAVTGLLGIEVAHISRPEVILMDINLPGINGNETLALLRADPGTAHIPVIAISANAMPREVRKGLEAGYFRYLTKPFIVSEFMDALDQALYLADQKPIRCR